MCFYSQLFEEIRKTTYVGVLPVGFLFTKEYSDINTHLHNTPFVERPLVRKTEDGKLQVYGWETFEWFISKSFRRYNVDMAGFAFK